MGAAALHLAHVRQPTQPKRKRKRGGGDGDGPERFARLAKRIYSDDRADGDTRALLLAVAYAINLSGAGGDGKPQWAAVQQALGGGGGRRRYADPLAQMVRKDIPRYTGPQYMPGGYSDSARVCEGPRLRPYQTRLPAGTDAVERAAWAKRDAEDFRNTQGVCGDSSQHEVKEKDPVTGWHTIHYFCNRHRDHAARVAAQVKAQNEAAPEPIPNQGGLLPSYFDADWLAVYRWYSRREDWTPPSYGIRADDWPIPGQDTPIHHPRLRLVIGGADLEADPAGQETDQ